MSSRVCHVVYKFIGFEFLTEIWGLLTKPLSFSCHGREGNISCYAETLAHLCSMDHENSLVLGSFKFVYSLVVK